MERKQKIIIQTGMWLAAIVGSIFGLVFTIIGAALEWGPGGGMEGPFWKSLLVGFISMTIGIYVGELLVRKLAPILFKRPRSRIELSLLMFVICLVASLFAWALSWEAAIISATLMGSINWSEDMDMWQIIINTLMMSPVLGIPFYWASGIISGIITFIVARK